MHRRRGISVLSVLSLIVGVLVAEYAFAPLRDPYYPITVKPSQSDAGSTASPKATDPANPANQTQHLPAPVEHRNVASEADGDPMLATARPLIDAVWQTVSDKGSRVSPRFVPAMAVASTEPATRWMPPFLGFGAFVGTQRARTPVPQSGMTPAAATTPPSKAPVVTMTRDAGPVVSETPHTEGPVSQASAPGPMMAMNDTPSPSLTEGMTAPDAPASGPVPGNGPTLETEPSAPTESIVTTPDADKDVKEPMNLLGPMQEKAPLPEVSVPEPLSGSLLLFGVALGALSRRRRSV